MDQLPPELICLITQSLNTSSRAAFARCSRRYYSILLPHVYADVSLANECFSEEVGEWKNPSFFNTIMRRPELALAVRSLAFGPWYTKSDLRWAQQPGKARQFKFPGEWDVERFNKVVLEDPRFKHEAQIWLESLRLCIPDAFIALSMPRFTNLGYLAVSYPHGCELFDQLIADAVVDILPRLEEVFITGSEHEERIDAQKAIPFFSIPSLVKVGGASIWGGGSDNDGGARRFSSVTDIELIDRGVSDGLSAWINLCRELKSFRYKHSLFSDDSFAPGFFENTLTPHAATLERLWMEIDEVDYPATGTLDEDDLWIGSLEVFTALEVLGMPLRFLKMDHIMPEEKPARTLCNILPQSLKHLSLRDCSKDDLQWLPGQLKDMLRVKRCPDLKVLIIETAQRRLWSEALDQGVSRLCQEAGITLKVRPGFFADEAHRFFMGAGVEALVHEDSFFEGADDNSEDR
jgi:hypothetical protein